MDSQQDYTVLNVTDLPGIASTYFKVRRAFNTSDAAFDRTFNDRLNKLHLCFAWGKSLRLHVHFLVFCFWFVFVCQVTL